MKFIKLSLVTAAVMASTAAMAAEPSYAYNEDAGIVRNTTGTVISGTKSAFKTVINPASVSAEVGSLGYGANIGWSLNDKVELQAGWAGGDVADLFGGDFDVEDLNYDVDSDFSTPYLGVQLRPAGNWFTMGAGVIVPDNSIDISANANSAGNYVINNTDYAEAGVGTLTGSVEHRNELAPYLTVGFRPNISNNFGVFGEVGAAYLGKVDASVNASGADLLNAAGAAEAELENEDYLEWLPIVKLGATYRF